MNNDSHEFISKINSSSPNFETKVEIKINKILNTLFNLEKILIFFKTDSSIEFVYLFELFKSKGIVKSCNLFNLSNLSQIDLSINVLNFELV